MKMGEKSFNAMDYHKATGHNRFHMAGYSLDWASQPDVVKRYPEAEKISLIPVQHLDTSSLWDLCEPDLEIKPSAAPDLESLSAILAMGSGITFQGRHGEELYAFRSAASAGALYPVDLYVDACRVEGLDPGLYHDHIGDFTLERLKKKDSVATASDLSPWAVIYVTGVFVRSSWKYRGRAYRYILNDAGHVIANIVLEARSLGFSIRLDYDFVDGPVNAFLGLDHGREVCLARLCLFTRGTIDSETEVSPVLWGMSLPIPDGDYGRGGDGAIPLEISMIHETSSLAGAENRNGVRTGGENLACAVKGWQLLADKNKPLFARPFGESLVQRRSRRNFQIRPLEQELFLPLMDLVMKGFDLMKKTSRVHGALKLGLLVRDVNGFCEGHYVSDINKQSIGCIDSGDKTGVMASACLDQRWLANASVHFVMTSDLERVEREVGVRAYRYMMMNAGILGQIIYLAATSLGLGCCGIGAFYDNEASMVLGGDDECLLYMVAAGHVKGSR